MSDKMTAHEKGTCACFSNHQGDGSQGYVWRLAPPDFLGGVSWNIDDSCAKTPCAKTPPDAGVAPENAVACDLRYEEKEKAKQWTSIKTGGFEMRAGFVLVKTPGLYGPVRVGWLRHVENDTWELLPGACLINRIKGERLIEHVAADGPMDDHHVWPPAKMEMWVDRYRVIDIRPASEEAWAQHCPKPLDWGEGK